MDAPALTRGIRPVHRLLAMTSEMFARLLPYQQLSVVMGPPARERRGGAVMNSEVGGEWLRHPDILAVEFHI